MDLPKNVTQIGESDHGCKMYVEDYVISFIKQMNQMAGDKEMAVALYGVRKEENDISYLFFYGACKLDFLSREVRHLSQAQSQEIEKLRKRYFAEYQFLGYRLLNGEMVEGFHVCEQGICRYIKGYACFYEKNDSMLAYMLDTRKEEVPPEEVDQEKYERVRKRQEERRAQSEEESRSRSSRRQSREEEAQTKEPVLRTSRTSSRFKETAAAVGREPGGEGAAGASGRTVRIMRASVVGVFALLCIVGLTTLNGYGKMEKLQVAARQLLAEFTEKKIPDADDAVSVMSSTGQSDTLVTEDKLTDAIQKENAGQSNSSQASGPDSVPAETLSETAPQETQDSQPQESAGQESSQPQGQDQQTADSGGQDQQSAAATQAPAPSQDSGQSETNPVSPAGPLGESAESSQPSEEQQPSQPASAPVAYVIQKGDTLIGISLRQYGTENRVKDICTLNDIKNPDDIRFGQKILLP